VRSLRAPNRLSPRSCSLEGHGENELRIGGPRECQAHEHWPVVRGPFKIMVFVGATQGKIPLEMARVLQAFGPDVEYIQMDGNGTNALDFHIAYYIGRLAAKCPSMRAPLSSPGARSFLIFCGCFPPHVTKGLRRSYSRFVHGRRLSLNRSRWTKGEELRPHRISTKLPI
jgi:hypothetical protein